MNNDFLDVLENGLELAEDERWENLTLANDFMFGKVFQDPGLCLDLVRIILPELNIERIAFTEQQKSFHETLDTRGVRFDIYLRDDKSRIINVEMQPVNRDNIIKRSRAYHSIIDLDAMDKGTMKVYNDMPEAIVIFICCFDLFHAGRHIYTFKKFCAQDKDLMLNDGETTIFLNTRGTKDDISPKLRAFLEFVEGKSSGDEFVKRLEHRFFEAKQNRYWRQVYMFTKFDANSLREEGRKEGIAEGQTKMFDAIMKFMKASGLTSLTLEQLSQFMESTKDTLAGSGLNNA